MRNHLAFLICLALVQSAIAQQGNGNGLVGHWVGTMPGLSGNQLGVELAIGESSGTFRLKPPSVSAGRNNPCFGKDLPVTIVSQSASEAVVQINGSALLQGCMDQTVTLKSADGKSMEGSLPDGRQIKLNRK